MRTKKHFLLLAISALVISITGLLCAFNAPQTFAYAAEESENVESGETVEAALVPATEQDGLGYGINVLTATSYNSFNLGYSILDSDWLAAAEANRVNVLTDDTYTRGSVQAYDFLPDFSFECDGGAGISSFIAMAELTFKASTNFNFEGYSYKSYNTFTHKIRKYRAAIKDFEDKTIYENAFSQNFLNDIAAVSNGTMTVDTLFTRYGTHLVGSAVYGGRLDASYTVASNEVAFRTDVQNVIKSTVSFLDVNTLSTAYISGAINAKLSTTYTASDFSSCFAVNKCGGYSFVSNTPAAFQNGYAKWVDSFNGTDANVVVMDFENGLLPIWEILPDSYSSVAEKIKNRYIEKYQINRNAFTNKFKVGDYVYFAGGVGDSNNPYKISTKTHLRNIERDYKASYVLINDVDLDGSTWSPIGGCYLEYYFNGSFDGKGYSILNLKSPSNSDISSGKSRYFYGLFGAIGPTGVVQNIDLKNLKINFSDSRTNNGSYKFFIGGFAGCCVGTLRNCIVSSGYCTYNKCAAGTVYVGGICGIASLAKLSFCENYVDVLAGRYSGVAGGITGYCYSTDFRSCKNTGNITAYCTWWGGFSYAGGISGLKCYGDSSSSCDARCSNSGKLKATDYSHLNTNHGDRTNPGIENQHKTENFA